MRLSLVVLLLALPALARGPGKHTQDYHQGANSSPAAGAGASLLLLAPGQVAVSPLTCTAAAQLGLLSGSYACLSGDGTQDSSTGYTLSAVGSPTTQTMEWAPNGSNNAQVSRQRWTTSDSYQSASLSPPSGDFSVCHVGMVDAPLSAVTLVSGPGYSLSITSAGVATFTSGGSSVSSASGAVVGGADQLICGTRAGTAGVVYVGATGVLGTVAAPSGSAVLKVGGFAGGTRGALFASKVLSSTDVSRLQAALVPVPQTATGALISNSRNSASWVTTSGGALVALPPGRTGVVGPPGSTGVVGGVVSSPSRTNVLLWSEDLSASAWTIIPEITVTKNNTSAPDGSLTADTLASDGTATSRSMFQGVTANGGGYTISGWGKAGTSTAGFLRVFDSTSGVELCASAAASSSTWTRLSCSTGPTVTGHSITVRIYPVGLAAVAGNSAWFGVMAESGSTPSPYCRSEGTSATCAGDVLTVPTPGWLSTKEGCAAWCSTSPFTGANPVASVLSMLSGNTAGTARLGYVPASAQSVAISDGTHTATLATTYTAGARRCFRSTWSASAGTLTIADVTGGTSASASSFAGFASLGTTIGVGNENGGAQPLGAIVDSVRLGTSPGGCR